MKQKLPILLAICLAVSTLVFALLWQDAKNDRSDLEALAQTSALESYDAFRAYNERDEESDYLKAVAAFRSFQQAYGLLVQDTNKDVNYLYCNELYGQLVLHPEKCQPHIDAILTAMQLLSQKVTDENGYLKMREAYNLIYRD